MNYKIDNNKSSILVSLPALITLFLLTIICAFLKYQAISRAFLIALLICLLARLWAGVNSNSISMRVVAKSICVFAGETIDVNIKLENKSFIPIPWSELSFPLDPSLCVVPELTRVPEEYERDFLEALGASTHLIGEKKLPALLWYEALDIPNKWKAEKRGLYSIDHWTVKTGDGFGLVQIQKSPDESLSQSFVVYPKLVDVNIESFVKNFWDANIGSSGVLEDTSIIKSTRDYSPNDSYKSINWKLTAKGLPLTVNIYERILPKGFHFIFDAESFHNEGSEDETEDALSILASIACRLINKKIAVGISIPKAESKLSDIFTSYSTPDLLYLLASFKQTKDVRDDEGKPIHQTSHYNTSLITEHYNDIACFYIITYKNISFKSSTLLKSDFVNKCKIIEYEQFAKIKQNNNK